MRSIAVIYCLTCCLFYKPNLNAQNNIPDKAQTQRNTSFKPGENWYDENGNIINAHGGGILFYKGTYYWYGEIKKGETTRVPDANWENYRVIAGGISCYSSKDLLHWSTQEFIPVMMKEDSARNTWAPEITYDPYSRQYMVYWATTINGRFPITDTAAESRYNHRIYYVTTKDFKKWSETKLLYDPGFNVIDASIVWNGTEFVMFLKNETRAPEEKNIRVAYSKKITGPWSSPSAPITGNYWAEGPTAMRIGKEWIVYFDKYRNHKYGAVSSTDLIHWQDISNKVRFPSGTRHGTIFAVTQKEFDKLTGN